MLAFYWSEFSSCFKFRTTIQPKEFYPENRGTLPPLYIYFIVEYPQFLY